MRPGVVTRLFHSVDWHLSYAAILQYTPIAGQYWDRIVIHPAVIFAPLVASRSVRIAE